MFEIDMSINFKVWLKYSHLIIYKQVHYTIVANLIFTFVKLILHIEINLTGGGELVENE